MSGGTAPTNGEGDSALQAQQSKEEGPTPAAKRERDSEAGADTAACATTGQTTDEIEVSGDDTFATAERGKAAQP